MFPIINIVLAKIKRDMKIYFYKKTKKKTVFLGLMKIPKNF